jgi:hypothetical protein
MLELTLASVKTNAKKAYDEKRLIPQQKFVTKCLYRNDQGAVCAIGASLPPDFPLTEEENASPLSMGLVQSKFLIDPFELSAILTIQGAHDRWAAAVKCQIRYAKILEARFLALIS